MQNKIIVISGPTATGKTDLSIRLAKKYDAEIINFDSLVFYKEISIGTAKPTREEQEDIPHHFVGSESIFNPINAADFYKMCIPLLQELLNQNKNVILVGGSGFYLQTVLKGMFESITTPEDLVDRSNQLYSQEGIEPFREILKQEDIKSFERYHENDHYRIRRAVEHFWTTGKPFSNVFELLSESVSNESSQLSESK